MATIFGTIDVGGNGKEILLNYVNSQLGYIATLDDFEFGVPERIGFDGTKYNTKIALAPKANSGYYGVKTIYYNRIHVSELGKIRCVRGTATKVSHLLQQINEKYGILVSPSDIVDNTLPPPDSTGEVEVEFTFKDSSIVFYSGTYITLGEHDPSIVDPEDIEPFVSRYMFFADNVYSLPDLPRNNEDIRPDVKPTILEAFSVVINASGQRQVTADVTNPLNNKFLSVLDYDGSLLRVKNDNLTRTESGIPQYEATYKNEDILEPVYKGCNNYRNFIVGSFIGEFIYEAYCVDTNGNVYKRSADNTNWEHISAMPGPCDFVLQSAEGTVYGVNKGLYGTGALYTSTDFGQTFSSTSISDSSKYVSNTPANTNKETQVAAIEILDKVMVGDDIYVLYKVIEHSWIQANSGSQPIDIEIFPVVTRIRTSTGSVSSWNIKSIEDKNGSITNFNYEVSNQDLNIPKYYFSLKGSFIANVAGETIRPSIALYCNETVHLLEANEDEDVGYVYGYPIYRSFFPSQSIYKGSYIAAYTIEETEKINAFIDIIEVGTGIPTDKLDKEIYYEIAKHRTYDGYYGHGIKFLISVRYPDHRTEWKEIDYLLEPGSYPGTISMYYKNIRHYLSYQPQGYLQRFTFNITSNGIEPIPDEEFRARIGKHTGYLNYSTFGTCLLTEYKINSKNYLSLVDIEFLPKEGYTASYIGKDSNGYKWLTNINTSFLTDIKDYQSVKYISKYPLGDMIESIKFETDAERDSFINDPIFVKPSISPFTIDYTSLVRGVRYDNSDKYGIDYFTSIDIKPENIKLATKNLERNLLVSYTVPKDTKNEWLENTEPLTQDKTIYLDNSTYQHVVFKDNFTYKPLAESLYIHPWLVDEYSFILNKYRYNNNTRYIEGNHYSHTEYDYDDVTEDISIIPNYTLPSGIELVDIRSVVGCFCLKAIICIKDVSDLHKLILIDNDNQIKEYPLPVGFKVEAVWNDTAFFRDHGNVNLAPDFVPIIYYSNKKIVILGPLYKDIGLAIKEYNLDYQKGNGIFRLEYEFDTRVNVITNVRLNRLHLTTQYPDMDLYYSAFSEYIAYDLGNKIGPTYYEVPPADTEITTYCDGEALISVKSDGEGGVYEEVIDENSVGCGAIKEVCTVELEQYEANVTPLAVCTIVLTDFDSIIIPRCEVLFTGKDINLLSTISLTGIESNIVNRSTITYIDKDINLVSTITNTGITVDLKSTITNTGFDVSLPSTISYVGNDPYLYCTVTFLGINNDLKSTIRLVKYDTNLVSTILHTSTDVDLKSTITHISTDTELKSTITYIGTDVDLKSTISNIGTTIDLKSTISNTGTDIDLKSTISNTSYDVDLKSVITYTGKDVLLPSTITYLDNTIDLKSTISNTDIDINLMSAIINTGVDVNLMSTIIHSSTDIDLKSTISLSDFEIDLYSVVTHVSTTVDLKSTISHLSTDVNIFSDISLVDIDVNLMSTISHSSTTVDLKSVISNTSYDVELFSTISLVGGESSLIPFKDVYRVSYPMPLLFKDKVASNQDAKVVSVKYMPMLEMPIDAVTATKPNITEATYPTKVIYSNLDFIPSDNVTSNKVKLLDISQPYKVTYSNLDFIPSDSITSIGNVKIEGASIPYRVIYSSYKDKFKDSVTTIGDIKLISVVLERP